MLVWLEDFIGWPIDQGSVLSLVFMQRQNFEAADTRAPLLLVWLQFNCCPISVRELVKLDKYRTAFAGKRCMPATRWIPQVGACRVIAIFV